MQKVIMKMKFLGFFIPFPKLFSWNIRKKLTESDSIVSLQSSVAFNTDSEPSGIQIRNH